MYRMIGTLLALAVGYDIYMLDGKYLHAAESMFYSMLHFFGVTWGARASPISFVMDKFGYSVRAAAHGEWERIFNLLKADVRRRHCRIADFEGPERVASPGGSLTQARGVLGLLTAPGGGGRGDSQHGALIFNAWLASTFDDSSVLFPLFTGWKPRCQNHAKYINRSGEFSCCTNTFKRLSARAERDSLC
jgi:hypothetical protein